MEPPPSKKLRHESYLRGRIAAASAGLAASAALAWAFLRYRPSRVAIEGPSMAPTLVEGDWVLVATPRRFRTGQVVLVEHPGRPGYEMVKRIAAGPGDEVDRRVLRSDEYWIEGDDPSASTDSRHFGPITRDHLRARVIAVYRPMARRGLVR